MQSHFFFFVCRNCLRGVAWFSYWYDNLGFITEGNTYRSYVASSLPLWGNTDAPSPSNKKKKKTNRTLHADSEPAIDTP